MENIRVIENPRHCMQRMGFLKYVVYIASQTSVTSLENIGYKLIADVTKRYSVKLNKEHIEYILRSLTHKKYSELRNHIKNMNGKNINEASLELQDIYLSDNKMPSKRGRLVDEDKKQYPYFAITLGLTRKQNYSLMVRGKSFLYLVSPDEIDGFKMLKDTNPLLLTLPQKILLLYSIIERDGDALRELYSIILKEKESFELRDIGYNFSEIFNKIAKFYLGKTRNMDELEKVSKLKKTAEKIKEKKDNIPTGGVSVIEHVAKPRIETFVDLGLLSKPDPYSYHYFITNSTKSFFEAVINSDDVERFLKYSYFRTVNDVFQLNSVHILDKKIILPFVQEAYTILKSPLGYAPILEVLLLAGIIAIVQKRYYFEISESLEILKLYQKENPEMIRFNVDRGGNLTFVKFNNKINFNVKE